MEVSSGFATGKRPSKGPESSNVKSRPKYDRFGETIRYLTIEELQKLFDSIQDYRHKLILRMIYELGCRVGEFVRIQLKHLDFNRSAILFPVVNTKTRHQRTSHLPRGLMNEVVSLLRSEGRVGKKDLSVRKPDTYLFHPPSRPNRHYSENRLRQIFRHYADKVGLSHEYGTDTRGRSLHRLTPHSLRHAHISNYIHVHKLPLPIVQKQVGHRSLHSTSVYLNPSEEAVAAAYSEVQAKTRMDSKGPTKGYHRNI
jgi:integrase